MLFPLKNSCCPRKTQPCRSTLGTNSCPRRGREGRPALCLRALGQALLRVQGKRNRMDSCVSSRDGPSLPSPSLCSRSVQRWGQNSSVLFFSHHLELTRAMSGPCTPWLPEVEAPTAGAASGLRATCCPAGWLGAATTLGGITRKGFSDRNPNRRCQGCFPPSFRFFRDSIST